MRSSALLRLFMLLLLSSFSMVRILGATSLTAYPFCTSSDVSGYTLSSTNLPVQAEGLALLALTVSFDVIGVAYIVNKLFPTAGLQRWLQEEYKEIAKTALLIISIFAVITIVAGLALALTGTTPGGSYSDNVNGLLTQSELSLCNVNTYLFASITNMAQLSLQAGALHSLKIEWDGIPIPVFAVTFKSGAVFDPFYNNFLAVDNTPGADPSLLYEVITVIYFPLINIFTIQMSLLPLLMTVGLTVLIPIGLIMRAFPLVRGIGGTLVAFGLLLAVIWPSTLVLFNNPISSYFYNALNIGPSTSTAACTIFGILSPICNAIGTLGVLGTLTSTAITNPVLAVSGAGIGTSTFPSIDLTSYSSLVSSTTVLPIALSTINEVYDSLNYILANTVFLIFEFFFVFIFDIAIAYTITDNIARMLGGSIRLQLGGKLKLI